MTLVTNDFIRDELATLPSATPYQRGITSEDVPSNNFDTVNNPGNYLVSLSSLIEIC